MRVRYRNRPRINILNGTFKRDFFSFFRMVICTVFLVAVINSIGKNFYAAVENISEYKAAQLVNEYIDMGVLSVSSLYQDKSFVIVGYNNDGVVTSVETDTIEVNRFASILSESIQKRLRKGNTKNKGTVGFCYRQKAVIFFRFFNTLQDNPWRKGIGNSAVGFSGCRNKPNSA